MLKNEKQESMEIFKLAELMKDAGLDFYFNFDDDSQYGEEVFDEEYEYMIETQTGELIGSRAPITVFQREDGLELLDMRPARGNDIIIDSDGAIHSGFSAEEAMEIIEEFFKTA